MDTKDTNQHAFGVAMQECTIAAVKLAFDTIMIKGTDLLLADGRIPEDKIHSTKAILTQKITTIQAIESAINGIKHDIAIEVLEALEKDFCAGKPDTFQDPA